MAWRPYEAKLHPDHLMRCSSFILSLLLTVATAVNSFSQEDYRFDAGGGLGLTGYLGDANSANLWSHPSWDAQLLFRYIMNPRLALKTNLFAGGLSGNAANMDNVLPQGNDYKFSTTFYELEELVEFNFFNYGIGETYRKLKRFSPYICAGLGVTLWKVGGTGGAAFTIPLGFGVKYKPSRRVNLGLEFLMKKTFTDRLDGEFLDDPVGIKSSFMKNTDWFSTLTFTVSYEFSKRCAVCNYKD
ncbi:MAG: outer membrane beta-barrel protein [Muribaculaceae bacterium]|nr:outer membrane beta-barrel protein [Muribaculaceae bacterium]